MLGAGTPLSLGAAGASSLRLRCSASGEGAGLSRIPAPFPPPSPPRPAQSCPGPAGRWVPVPGWATGLPSPELLTATRSPAGGGRQRGQWSLGHLSAQVSCGSAGGRRGVGGASRGQGAWELGCREEA